MKQRAYLRRDGAGLGTGRPLKPRDSVPRVSSGARSADAELLCLAALQRQRHTARDRNDPALFVRGPKRCVPSAPGLQARPVSVPVSVPPRIPGSCSLDVHISSYTCFNLFFSSRAAFCITSSGSCSVY